MYGHILHPRPGKPIPLYGASKMGNLVPCVARAGGKGTPDNGREGTEQTSAETQPIKQRLYRNLPAGHKRLYNASGIAGYKARN